MTADTIVALSTPPGRSGLAVVRLSGPDTLAASASLLGHQNPESHRMYHGKIRETKENSGETLDRLNYVFMAAPRTSTGEDVLEIYPHGNPILVRRILDACLAVPGVRLAQPGEFTRRSFENGKVDLVQAESVGQLIHAQSLGALRNAQKALSGELSKPLGELKESLKDLAVRLELDVDFAEEEADPDYESWQRRLESIAAQIETLATSFRRGRSLDREPRVGLFGAPNAGKSSLINALVRQDRLLVSAQPGTTRDYVEVPLTVDTGSLLLVDTAGLGTAVDQLDALAMERTRAVLAQCDYRILLQDGAKAPRPDLEDAGDFHLRLATKSDLKGFCLPKGWLPISSVTGAGVQELLTHFATELFEDFRSEEGVLVASERQFQALEKAGERVQAALENLRRAPAVEILAFEIREACSQLKELLGETRPEDILSRIFSGFCIGK